MSKDKIVIEKPKESDNKQVTLPIPMHVSDAEDMVAKLSALNEQGVEPRKALANAIALYSMISEYLADGRYISMSTRRGRQSRIYSASQFTKELEVQHNILDTKRRREEKRRAKEETKLQDNQGQSTTTELGLGPALPI